MRLPVTGPIKGWWYSGARQSLRASCFIWKLQGKLSFDHLIVYVFYFKSLSQSVLEHFIITTLCDQNILASHELSHTLHNISDSFAYILVIASSLLKIVKMHTIQMQWLFKLLQCKAETLVQRSYNVLRTRKRCVS